MSNSYNYNDWQININGMVFPGRQELASKKN